MKSRAPEPEGVAPGLTEGGQTGQPQDNTQTQENQQMVSGFGGYHTANPTCATARPYTTITLDGIYSLAAIPPTVEKSNAQWIIPSTATGKNARIHAYQKEHGQFVALWADLDDVEGLTFLDVTQRAAAALPGTGALIYTTASAQETQPKSRIIVPLKTTVPGAYYSMVARILNDRLDAAGLTPDRAPERPGQLCYLPNRGDFYQHHIIDGPPLDAGAEFSSEIKEAQARAKSEKQARARRHAEALRKAQERINSGKINPVQAYRDAYPVEVALEHYGYIRRGNKWLSPHSESGTPGVSVKDNKWFSHHTGDAGIGQPGPEGSTWGDPFDLFVFFEHGGNFNPAVKAAAAMFAPSDTGAKPSNKQNEPPPHPGDDSSARNDGPPADDTHEKPGPTATIDPSKTAARAAQILKDRAAPAQFDTTNLPAQFREYVAEICARTNTDPIIIVMAVLTSLSAMVGTRAYIPEGIYFSRLYALLWVLIQDSSGSFKTTGLNKGSRLIWRKVGEIHDAIKETEREKLIYGTSTSKEDKENIDALERKIKQLRYTSPLMPNKASAEGLLELMANEQRGAILCSEFGEWLANMGKTHNAGLKALFTELFDVPEQYSYMTRGGGNMIIRRPFVSILGLSTPQWIHENISLGDVGSGFFARFLLCAPPEKRTIPPALPRYTTPINDDFEWHIKSNLETIKNDRKFGLTPEAREAFEQIHYGIYEAMGKQCTKEEQEKLDPYTKRWSPYVLKLAMLFQIMDDPGGDIGIGAIIPSAALVDYVMESTIYLFRGNLGLSPFQRHCEAVLNYVAKRNGRVKRQDLLSSRVLSGGAKEYDEVLTMLEESGKLNTQASPDGAKSGAEIILT